MPRVSVEVPKALWHAIEAEGKDPESEVRRVVRQNLKPVPKKKRQSLTGDAHFRPDFGSKLKS